jgi:hypothetical protein
LKLSCPHTFDHLIFDTSADLIVSELLPASFSSHPCGCNIALSPTTGDRRIASLLKSLSDLYPGVIAICQNLWGFIPMQAASCMASQYDMMSAFILKDLWDVVKENDVNK